MFTYDVHITTQISDHIYDIGVKGQGHIYLKSVLRLVHFVTQTPQALSFFDEGYFKTISIDQSQYISCYLLFTPIAGVAQLRQ